MNEREIRVLNYMLSDWREPHRLTNVEQAVAATGALHDVETRKRIGRYLVKYLSLLDTPRKQQPALRFVLTNDETLVARHLIQTGQPQRPIPDLASVAGALRLERREVQDAFNVLNEFNVLDQDEAAPPPHFRLSPKVRLLTEDLNFTFTQLVRAEGTSFNVTCVPDALELARGHLRKEVVRVQSVCAHCNERVRLTMTRGALTAGSVAPYLVLGPRCLHHLVFASEAHARDYVRTRPELRTARMVSAGEFLASAERGRRGSF